eukprot:g960.t1
MSNMTTNYDVNNHFATVGDFSAANSTKWHRQSLRENRIQRRSVEEDFRSGSKDMKLAFTGKNVEREQHSHLGVTKEQIDQIRHRVRQHAYRMGGVDLRKEFQEMDENKDGTLSYVEFIGTVRRLCPISDRQAQILLQIVDADTNGIIEYDELERFVFSDEYPDHLVEMEPEKEEISVRPPGADVLVGIQELKQELTRLQEECNTLEQVRTAQRSKMYERKRLNEAHPFSSSRRRMLRMNWQHRVRTSEDVAHARSKEESTRRVSARMLEDTLLKTESDLRKTTRSLQDVSLGLDQTRRQLAEKKRELSNTNREADMILRITRVLSSHMARMPIASRRRNDVANAPISPSSSSHNRTFADAGDELVKQATVGNKLHFIFDALRTASAPTAAPDTIHEATSYDESARFTPGNSMDQELAEEGGHEPTLEEMSSMSEGELAAYFMSKRFVTEGDRM